MLQASLLLQTNGTKVDEFRGNEFNNMMKKCSYVMSVNNSELNRVTEAVTIMEVNNQ